MKDIKDLIGSNDKIFKARMKKKEKFGSSEMLGCVIGIILTFTPLFFTVYIKSQNVKNGYKITELVMKLQEIQDKKDNLESKLMKLENPVHLYPIAKKMGYDVPSVQTIFTSSPHIIPTSSSSYQQR